MASPAKRSRFSTLQRVEIAEIFAAFGARSNDVSVSVLFNESKLLKCCDVLQYDYCGGVSVLFNESKLLKSATRYDGTRIITARFSTLQRVEIAEINVRSCVGVVARSVSVLFNESKLLKCIALNKSARQPTGVSVLFNESKLLKSITAGQRIMRPNVSVLFNESKLLKYGADAGRPGASLRFSTLQRVEIAEIFPRPSSRAKRRRFQYSSTSRNC